MRSLNNKTNVKVPDSEFPYGRIKDSPGDNTGTPFNELLYGDMHQFFSRMFAKSGLVANELPDSAYSGFQLYEAMLIAGVPYKTYTALITQSGTNAPTVKVMSSNGIGSIVWTRSGAGVYLGSLTGAFTADKTICEVMAVWDFGISQGFVSMQRANANAVTLRTYNNSLTPADDCLSDHPITIKVYRD